MRNIFVILLVQALSAMPFLLDAQNLDPTVEVTREYQGKLMEIHKPSLEMAVPDSVMHFALDFDYSVFENPYKGSYEFNPYLLAMRPSSSDNGERKLYLKAGVGYTLHPELDLVWSPKFKSRSFNMDVYALHRSYVGKYWNLVPESGTDGDVEVTRPAKGSEDRTWSGYDLLSKTGVDCRYDARVLALDFGAGYYGLAQKNRHMVRDYNALDLHFGLETKPETPTKIVYDVEARYRYGQDDSKGKADLSEHLFDFDMSFGPVVSGKHRLNFDLGVKMASYGLTCDSTIGEVSVSPHYIFGSKRLRFDLGVRLAKLVRSDAVDSKEQFIYPDITLSYALFRESLKFFVTADGGNTLDTYSSIIGHNHHITYAAIPSLLECTMERANVAAGFDGRISSRFSYNLRGGYANYGSALLDAIVMGPEPSASLVYGPYQKWFVSLDFCLNTEILRIDGDFSYDHAWGDLFDGADAGTAVLKPAAFTGDVAFEYNWNRRVFCGLDCEFATARKGVYTVPGYADLGLLSEYATSRGLSFWLRAGNLLNMTVQKNPLYAEWGVNFTVGICYTL